MLLFPGSPFTVKVTAVPDARKVRVYGEGIQDGILATYRSSFTVDTRGAGPGQLTVKVRGPKGNACHKYCNDADLCFRLQE
jgi:filamin